MRWDFFKRLWKIIMYMCCFIEILALKVENLYQSDIDVWN